MKTIEASELAAGQAFRKPGQRKWRIAGTVARLAGCRDDLLVCLHDCSQMTFANHDLVEIPKEPGDLDRDGFIKLGVRHS